MLYKIVNRCKLTASLNDESRVIQHSLVRYISLICIVVYSHLKHY